MEDIKRLVALLVLLSAIPLTVCCSFAMTVESVERAQNPRPAAGAGQAKPVYLLDWTNNQLRTNQGTFFLSKNIKVINKSGLDKDEIASQENPPVVQFIKKSGRVIEVVLLPNKVK